MYEKATLWAVTTFAIAVGNNVKRGGWVRGGGCALYTMWASLSPVLLGMFIRLNSVDSMSCCGSH